MDKNIVAITLLVGSTTCAFAQVAAPPLDADNPQEKPCGGCSIQGGDSSGARQVAAQPGEGSGKDRRSVFTVEQAAAAGDGLDDVQRTASAAHLLGRTGYLGMAGDFSALMLGPGYTLDYLLVSPGVIKSRGGTSGAPAATDVGPGWAESSSQSYTARMNGVAAGAAYGVERFDGSRAGRAWGLSLGFDVGPLTISAAHQNRHVANIHLYDLAGNNLDARNSIVSASVKASWGTAYAAYSINRGWGSSPLFNPENPYSAGVASMPSTDSHDVMAGVAVPLGHSTTLLASVIHKDDRDLANRDANQFAVGASYMMSRRTDFYAAVTRIHSMGSAGIPIGFTGGTTAVNLGMRHSF